MYKKLILPRGKPVSRFLGRHRVGDVSYLYRMPAGFPGDVNRSHPHAIEPCVFSVLSPPTLNGQPLLIDPSNQGVRPLGAADNAITTIWGVLVRSYPYQQATAVNYGAIGFGAAAPPFGQPLDVLKLGYIMVQLPPGQMCIKGGPVFVWTAASVAGSHQQGGFEAVASQGNTIALDPLRYQFNGSPDATGIAELIVKD